MEKMENVVVKYDSATGRIAVKGKTIRIVLTINQTQLMQVYSGEEGRATVLVSIMEDLNEGVSS